MFTISCPPKVIWLGRKGENEFRTIEVEVSEWLRDYPNGTVSVVYHRPDGAIYLPAVTTIGNVTSWIVTATDTAIAGKGEVEYRIIDGDVIGKSVKMPTMVSAAINATTDAPAPPPEDWTATAADLQGQIGDLTNLDTEAKTSLVDAVNELAQGGGTDDHRQLTNRDANNQHPMSAITGLVEALAAKGTYSKPAGGIPASDLASGVIPTVNDAVLTIKQGGVTKGTFSANASSATEINLDAGGGTSTLFRINVTENGGVYTPDKTYAEALTAYDAGMLLVMRVGQVDYYLQSKYSLGMSFSAGTNLFEGDLFSKTYLFHTSGEVLLSTEYGTLPSDAQISTWDGKLSDAPSDGKQYARQNGAWSEVLGGSGSGGVYIVHIMLSNGEYQFEQGGSWSTIFNALYTSDKVVVAEIWNGDGDEEQYVYSFAGYSDISDAGRLRFVFYRKNGNKTEYLYVHGDNTITAEVVDLDDYAQKSDLNDYRTAAAQDVIDGGFVKLVGTAGQTIQTNVAVPLNVKNNIALQHRAFVGFQTHDDNAIGFIGVDGGKPTFLAADGVTAKALQGETITDVAGYYTTDTVEGALAEIGAELSGINTLIGSGVIT